MYKEKIVNLQPLSERFQVKETNRSTRNLLHNYKNTIEIMVNP